MKIKQKGIFNAMLSKKRERESRADDETIRYILESNIDIGIGISIEQDLQYNVTMHVLTLRHNWLNGY